MNKAVNVDQTRRCHRGAAGAWRAVPRCWTPSPMRRRRSSAVADWRVGIQELLNRLGRATDVSRVTLFEFHKGPDGEPAESCRYDWAEPGYARLSDDPRYHNIPLKEPEGQLHEWAAGAPARRDRPGDAARRDRRDPPDLPRARHAEPSSPSRSCCAPASGASSGSTIAEHERVWHALEIDVLKTAAALIAGAIERAATDEALRSSRERYALAARGANDGLWDWDLTEDRTYFSPRLYEILGLPEGTLASPKAFARQLRPSDAVQSGASTWRHCVAERRRKFEFEARLARGDAGAAALGGDPRPHRLRARRRHPPGRLAARHHRPQERGDRPARQRDPRARHSRHRVRCHHHHRPERPDRRVQQRRHPHLRPCPRRRARQDPGRTDRAADLSRRARGRPASAISRPASTRCSIAWWRSRPCAPTAAISRSSSRSPRCRSPAAACSPPCCATSPSASGSSRSSPWRNASARS